MHSCYNEPDYKKEGKVNCMIGYYNYTVILTYCSLISAIVGTHFAFEHNYVLALFCLMLCGFLILSMVSLHVQKGQNRRRKEVWYSD